jgi:hypothetical protein
MTYATMIAGPWRANRNRTAVVIGDEAGRASEFAAVQRQTIRELDAWCRANDWPTRLNAWIAEEAVRRS